MEKVGLSESQIYSLSADVKKIIAELEYVRSVYGVRFISLCASNYAYPELSVHEDVEGDDIIKSAVTQISITENSICIKSTDYYNADIKKIEEK